MRLVILFFLLINSAFAEKIPHIQVQGNCEIKVIPDRGMISFSAENQSMDQKVAVKKTNDQINLLSEEIKKLKLKDLELKNSNYSVFPVREWEKNMVVNKGFRAALSLDVTTSEISRIGEAMVKSSTVGITNVGGLQTFLSLEKSQTEYLKCLDIAADDARKKALQLAKKLDFKIGDVIALNEVPNIQQPHYPERSMMKSLVGGGGGDAAPVAIQAGTQQYSTNIQVTFKIK